MITAKQAATLRHGDLIFSIDQLDARGHALKCRVTGHCKLWKRTPERFQLPVKHGLRNSFYIENGNAEFWTLNIEETRDKDNRKENNPGEKRESTSRQTE